MFQHITAGELHLDCGMADESDAVGVLPASVPSIHPDASGSLEAGHVNFLPTDGPRRNSDVSALIWYGDDGADSPDVNRGEDDTRNDHPDAPDGDART